MRVHESPIAQTVEWYTPPDLFDALGIRFDVDVASPAGGPVPWVPADHFITPAENGLMVAWPGRAWCNPPFGQMARPFAWRMAEHGNGILLVPARTETRIFQEVAPRASAVTFLRERLHFVREDGYQDRSGFPSVLLAFGDECGAALRAADLGWTP